MEGDTLDGMTIHEWRQEAIDRRKELIAYLEGKAPKKKSGEFKVGDHVRVKANQDCGLTRYENGNGLKRLQTAGDYISEIYLTSGNCRLESCPQFSFEPAWLEHA